MENHYSTLQTLAVAVMDLPNPTAYYCTPREMILRCSYDWATIFTHLQLLENEELVEIVNADTLRFSITQEGIDKVTAMQSKAEAVVELLKKTKLS
jgi:predicted transcriptional regulator